MHNMLRNKEKQIEEISNLLYCDKWEQPFMECPEDIKCLDCIVRKLYKQGYRKIDKDSVVLSREEYINNLTRYYGVSEIKDMVRKETAREIFDFIKNYFVDGILVLSEYTFTQIAKQFGVEIKE